MSRKVNEIGTSPAAMPLSPAESPASYALPGAPIGAAALPGSAPSSGAAFVSQRTDREAIDGVDRSFFLSILAALIAATAVCGLFAMSAALAIAPVVE